MACTIKSNRHGRLAFRLYWDGIESLEGTGLKDGLKNRKRVEARAELITEEMENGTFDYLKWFPEGKKATKFKPASANNTLKTVQAYFDDWI